MRGESILAKYEIGALIIRVVLGVIFFVHGLTKFQEGINETVTRFAEYGIPYAQYVAYGVGGIELLGGFFLIIGFSVRFVSALLITVMVGAIMKVKLEAGFLNGYEFNVALIAMASYLLVAGSRLLALDKLFTSEPKKKLELNLNEAIKKYRNSETQFRIGVSFFVSSNQKKRLPNAISFSL